MFTKAVKGGGIRLQVYRDRNRVIVVGDKPVGIIFSAFSRNALKLSSTGSPITDEK